MTDKLHVEITSPTGYIYNDDCHMAVVPSVEGDVGIKSHHEAILAELRAGKVSIYDEKDKLVEEFDITGGFAQVIENKLLVLADG